MKDSYGSFLVTSAQLFVLAACGVFGEDDAAPARGLVLDDTPLIVSVLEASADTLHHFPEVFVGRASDPLDPHYDFYADPESRLPWDLWHPMMIAQVMEKCFFMELKCVPEGPPAVVTLTGPVGQDLARSVTLRSVGEGVYGDVDRELRLVSGGRYRLEVGLSDGVRFSAETVIPGMPSWEAPDTVTISLRQGTYLRSDGSEGNSELGGTPIPHTTPHDAVLTLAQMNGELQYDQAVNALLPGERLVYESRGDFLREGLSYLIKTSHRYPHADHVDVSWAATPPLERRERMRYYLRLSVLNEDLAAYFQPELRTYASHHDEIWTGNEPSEARHTADTTYLPRISNIYRMDSTTAHPARKAVGVFGAYASAYRSVYAKIERNWDPDTVDWTP